MGAPGVSRGLLNPQSWVYHSGLCDTATLSCSILTQREWEWLCGDSVPGSNHPKTRQDPLVWGQWDVASLTASCLLSLGRSYWRASP